jgi:hypothetical protein
MTETAVELKSEDLLAALNRNLDVHFFLSDRTLSKQKFQTLKEGNELPLMKLGFSDESEIHCDLCLDYSEYVGKLNFSSFRKNLAMMMHAVRNRLDAGAPLNVMRDSSGQVLFNVPGIVKNGNQTNILVCGMAQTSHDKARINLMFLNPDDYESALSSALSQQS